MNGTKLATAFASGQGPDIFIISPGDFLRYYNGGVLLDLTPHIDADAAKADFPEGVIANRKVDGKIYGMPMEVEPMAFYYSVKAFEDAGLNENDVPKTWDELLELAKKLTTRRPLRRAVRDDARLLPEFHLVSVHVAGRRRVPGRGRQERVRFAGRRAGPEALAGRHQLRCRAAPGAAAAVGISSPICGSGYCAMQNIGIWGISAMDNNAPDVPYGIFKLPTPAGGKYVTVGGGWAFVANAKGKNPDAAAQVHRLGAGLDGAGLDPARRRLVHGGQVRHADAHQRAEGRAPRRSTRASSASSPTDILPGVRAEPRLPPEAYKIISDAIQAAQLGGADPQADSDRGQPAARCVPCHLLPARR